MTGWGIVAEEGAQARAVEYGVIRPAAGLPLPERLLTIFRELTAVMARYAPAVAAVETPFVPRVDGGSNRSALAIGQAQAAALLAAGQAGIAVAEYAPAEVKRTVAGYGRGDKAQVQRMIALQLGLAGSPGPPDAADALAVALCHLARRRAAALREVGT